MPEPTSTDAPAPSYVVIGTSAGGVNALTQIFKYLPAEFPGALLIVIHVYAWTTVHLAEALSRAGRLSAKVAVDGEPIRQGMAYLAPPDKHLFVEGERLRLGHGPPEQHARPAIDVLFRSAAAAFGPRTIGVILSGMLNDGALGLRAVSDAGGITIVQNPESAEAAEMPRSAMENTEVDYCIDLPEIGPLLELLVRRAGAYKQGALETGLASALRLMKDRATLLAKLYAKSRENPKTAFFLASEIEALDQELALIRDLIAVQGVHVGQTD